jgi:hypothetical protein
MTMNDNEPTVLEWLLERIKNPRGWLRGLFSSRSPKTNPLGPSTFSDDNGIQDSTGKAEFIESPSASQAGLVQVDISFAMPIGSSINLKVDTEKNEEGEKPSIRVVTDQTPNNLRATSSLLIGDQPSVDSSPNGANRTIIEWFASRKINIPIVTIFIILSIFLYIFTRFAGLNRFPAFFFSDEAMQSIYAEQLIDNHFLSANDENIPIYVPVEGNRWSPMASIYVQSVSVLLFGKSVLQTRATSIFVGLMGVLAVGLILKLIFKQKYWWVAILFLTLLPAWFLHSRTAFETVMATAFFAIFLLFYLLYRYRAPAFFFGAVFFGALTFYSYSNSQALMAVTTIGLLISDWRYHKKNWRTLAWSIPLITLMLIPFIIFRIKIPDGIESHLRAINSYWFQHISISEKIKTFILNYLIGLSPQYWFLANSRDLIRHRMIGYGHIPLWSLPLVLTGLVLALKNYRDSSYRAVLIAALAAPVGGSMLEISIARTLSFIVPATILAILGVEWILGWVERKIKPVIVATTVFIILTIISLATLNDAVNNGPLWTDIYGLYGLQYGAVQIFQDTLPKYVKDANVRHITVTPVWANATDRFVYFFFSPEEYRDRIYVDGIDTYLLRKQDLDPRDIFVWTVEEYQKALVSGKFKSIDIESTIPYPNGETGFIIARMQYADNIDDIFAAEKAARTQLIEEDIDLDGQTIHVAYSRLDGGELKNIFDGDPDTLMRGLEANPMIVTMEFPTERALSGLDVTTATMDDFSITVKLFDGQNEVPTIYQENVKNPPSDPTTSFDFTNGPTKTKKMIIEITHHTLEDPTHIHIREINLR